MLKDILQFLRKLRHAHQMVGKVIGMKTKYLEENLETNYVN